MLLEKSSPPKARVAHDTGYSNTANVGGQGRTRCCGAPWSGYRWCRTGGIRRPMRSWSGTRNSAAQIGGGSGGLRYDLTPDLDFDVRGYFTQARTDFDGNAARRRGNFGDDNEYRKSNQLLGYAGLTLRSPDRTFTNRVAFQYTGHGNAEFSIRTLRRTTAVRPPRLSTATGATSARSIRERGKSRRAGRRYSGHSMSAPRSTPIPRSFNLRRRRSRISRRSTAATHNCRRK